VDSEGIISTKQASTPTSYPFELVPVSDETAIRPIAIENRKNGKCYDLSGRRIENEKHFKGLYIKNGRKTIARP
jgi:hypothetical protein